MLTFVNNPQLPFRVQQVGTMVQIKPFAGYYIWLDWFDLAPLDQTALIEIVAEAASEAQTDANTAIANAATAQAAADAAQADADAALAAAGGITVDYPSQHFIIPNSTHIITGGFGSGLITGTPAALNVLYLMNGLNGEVNFKVPIPAGNYIVTIVGERYNGGADCSLYVDGTLHSMNHFYAAVAVHAYEVNYVVNGLTKGLHTFALKITGRQPGNTTSYSLYLSYILVRPNP